MRARATSKLRDLVGPENTLFDNLGLDYVGPVDGHKMDHLLAILKAARSYPQERPLLLHIVTRKGHGYAPAEAAADCYHGVNKFDVKSGEQKKSTGKPPSYTSVFARALIAEAERDPKIVGITAAMPSGTGIDAFSERFPDRSFDVAIAEQHAVTFAAGMAAEGMRPFCAIYSTFLQRAYDQVVHDVALQNLPVRFAMDRAGLVGADGPTHAGSFDIAYLGCLPNFVLMAPSDEVELMHMVATAARYDDGPIALRYPRGEGLGLKLPNLGTPLQLGRGRILREGSRIALLSFGGRLQEAMKAAELLALRGLSVTLADARFAKPLDRDLILNLSRNHEFIVTLEEGSRGGFATQVFHLLSDENLLDGRVRLKAMTLPDRFVAHGTPDGMYEDAGLAAGHIVAAVGDLVGRDKGPAREVVSLTRNASA
jgi:1-deoxy-D-xylulose-5-phosphate synthase